MTVNRDTLEDQLQNYEAELKELKSFIGELNRTASEHDTDRAHFEEDLSEAKHNVEYYESEVARLKKVLAGSGQGAGGGAGTTPPRPAKPGAGAVVLSAISFVTGALVGSKLKSRRGGKGTTEE